MTPGRRVYAVKAHVRDLPNPPPGRAFPADADGYVWLGREDFVGSWTEAKVYDSTNDADRVLQELQDVMFDITAWGNGYPDGAVPGRCVMVAFDMVAVSEDVRTRAAS